MADPTWKLLTTVTDHPTALSLAEVLSREGILVRLVSEASVLGQAATTRIFVEASRLYRARTLISQQSFTDEELTQLATGEIEADEV
jgi:hypothetical protein